MTCCVCLSTAGDAVQCQFERSGCIVDYEVHIRGFEASGFVFVGEERGQRIMYNLGAWWFKRSCNFCMKSILKSKCAPYHTKTAVTVVYPIAIACMSAIFLLLFILLLFLLRLLLIPSLKAEWERVKEEKRWRRERRKKEGLEEEEEEEEEEEISSSILLLFLLHLLYHPPCPLPLFRSFSSSSCSSSSFIKRLLFIGCMIVCKL